MIREMKKQARFILIKNYKSFLFPTMLYIVSNCVMGSSLFFTFNQGELFQGSSYIGLLFLCLYYIFQLVVLPISVFLFYKTSLRFVNDDIKVAESLCSPLSFQDVMIITSVWFVPGLLDFVTELLDGAVEYQRIPENGTLPILLVTLLLMTALLYLEYKFFACDYYYSLNKGTAKEVLSFSFKTMQGNFFRYLLLTLSFFPWYLLSAGLLFISTKIFPIADYWRFLLQSVGCGVSFFLFPYQYITYALFIKKDLENKRKR